MYYIPDGTKRCGYYQCEKCGLRFLSLKTDDTEECLDCSEEFDPEIGPDEEQASIERTAKLIQVLEDEEEIQKMDMLLSLAITGGDYNWI